MSPPMRHTSAPIVMLLALTAVFCGTTPATVEGFSLGQSGLPEVSPPAAPQHRELTLEERADVFMARKNYDDAIDYYLRALKQSQSKDPGVWNKLGIAFQQEGKFANARKAYVNATRADKDFAEPWNNLGTLYFVRKKYGSSVTYYLKAIKIKRRRCRLPYEYRLLLSPPQEIRAGKRRVSGRSGLIRSQGSVTRNPWWGPWSTPAGRMWNTTSIWPRHSLPAETQRSPCATSGVLLRMGSKTASGLMRMLISRKISHYPAFEDLMRNPPVAIKD